MIRRFFSNSDDKKHKQIESVDFFYYIIDCYVVYSQENLKN